MVKFEEEMFVSKEKKEAQTWLTEVGQARANHSSIKTTLILAIPIALTTIEPYLIWTQCRVPKISNIFMDVYR